MAIRFSVQNIDFGLTEADNIVLWLTEVIRRQQKSVGNISYLFCDDEQMLSANVRFLNHDTYTDIITFDYVSGGLVSGDILISVDRVGENARLYDVPFEQELRRVIVHGVLHLLGQGDKTTGEAAEMRRKEAEALGLYEQMFHGKRTA